MDIFLEIAYSPQSYYPPSLSNFYLLLHNYPSITIILTTSLLKNKLISNPKLLSFVKVQILLKADPNYYTTSMPVSPSLIPFVPLLVPAVWIN